MNDKIDLSVSVSLEEASDRFAKHVQRYNRIVAGDARQKTNAAFLQHLTDFSRQALAENCISTSYIDHASPGEVARKGYERDSLVKHRLAIVVNAFNKTFGKDKSVISEIRGGYARDDVTRQTLVFFQEEDPFYSMIGSQKTDDLSKAMNDFASNLPAEYLFRKTPVYQMDQHHNSLGTKVAALWNRLAFRGA